MLYYSILNWWLPNISHMMWHVCESKDLVAELLREAEVDANKLQTNNSPPSHMSILRLTYITGKLYLNFFFGNVQNNVCLQPTYMSTKSIEMPQNTWWMQNRKNADKRFIKQFFFVLINLRRNLENYLKSVRFLSCGGAPPLHQVVVWPVQILVQLDDQGLKEQTWFDNNPCLEMTFLTLEILRTKI